MLFAFSTNAFKNFSLTDAIRSIAQVGYDGVEILCDVPHAYPPAFAAGQVRQTKKLIADLNLKISNLNAFTLYALGDIYNPSWIDKDPKVRNQRVSHTVDCIKMAKKLGAANLSTEPGGEIANKKRRKIGEGNSDNLDRKALEKIFIKGILEISKVAERERIRILVEPEPNLLIENSGEFLHFIRNIPTDSVGLNFDIGHFYCVKEDPERLIYKLADYIGHVHLEDIAPSREHRHLIPGHGAINFKPIFNAFEGIGYKGFVTVELYPYQEAPSDAARLALNYLQNVPQ